MLNYELKLVDSSKLLADILVDDIGNSLKKFKEMLDVALLDKYPESMRAARILALCAEKNKKLVCPYVNQLVQQLEHVNVEGVKRGFLKILSENSECLDEDSWGIIANLAFEWMNNPKEAISIRYYCIDLMGQLQDQYPEIKEELISILESIMEDESKGLRTKCIKTLRKLNR
jgi:hypothetical protein